MAKDGVLFPSYATFSHACSRWFHSADGLYHLFMVIWGMVYNCFTNIIVNLICVAPSQKMLTIRTHGLTAGSGG